MFAPDLLGDEVTRTTGLKLLKASVMCLEESHSKQTPNLKKRAEFTANRAKKHILIPCHSTVHCANSHIKHLPSA